VAEAVDELEFVGDLSHGVYFLSCPFR
jgi:hypothetical protein